MTEEYPATPELDKMIAVRDQSQALGEFLDWLKNEQGVELCAYQEAGTNGEPYQIRHLVNGRSRDELNAAYGMNTWEYFRRVNGELAVKMDNPQYESWPCGFYPVRKSVQEWLAEYFGIDQQAMDAEREAVLEYVRRNRG